MTCCILLHQSIRRQLLDSEPEKMYPLLLQQPEIMIAVDYKYG